MTGGIAFALAALVCNGLGDVVYKRAARAGLAPDHFLMGQGWFFCPAMVAYAWLTGTLVPGPAALWGAVAGAVILVALYSYSRSLRSGAVSAVAPVFRLNFIVTAALAIAILHEPASGLKLGGFALAVAAGWLLLGGPAAERGSDEGAMRRPLARVLLATVAAGAANFCYKLGLVGGALPETILATQAVVFTGLVTATTWAVNGSIRPPRGFAQHSVPAAAALFAAFLFMLHGLARGEASIVVPIAQMGFVIAAILGVILFRERVTTRKAAGLAAACLALLLLGLA